MGVQRREETGSTSNLQIPSNDDSPPLRPFSLVEKHSSRKEVTQYERQTGIRARMSVQSSEYGGGDSDARPRAVKDRKGHVEERD